MLPTETQVAERARVLKNGNRGAHPSHFWIKKTGGPGLYCRLCGIDVMWPGGTTRCFPTEKLPRSALRPYTKRRVLSNNATEEKARLLLINEYAC